MKPQHISSQHFFAETFDSQYSKLLGFQKRNDSSRSPLANRIEIESKIPILGDIPLLGYLFRSTNIQNSKNEVMFTITAKIVQGMRGERADVVIPISGT